MGIEFDQEMWNSLCENVGMNGGKVPENPDKIADWLKRNPPEKGTLDPNARPVFSLNSFGESSKEK